MPTPLFHVEIYGIRDMQGRFVRATEEAINAKRQEIQALGQKARDLLRAEAPVRTGRLKRSIIYRTRVNSAMLTQVEVTANVPYLGYVIRGRGPVVARRAQALRFEPGPPGSGFIFRKRVGPAKANPFQARALERLYASGEPGVTSQRIAIRITRAFSGR
jgi:hypothetical protein